MKRQTWTEAQEKALRFHYPTKGLQWCADLLGKSAASVRQKAARLGLRQDPDSDFRKDWQARAAQSKIGKKRPEQAQVLSNLRAIGALKITQAGREALSRYAKQRIAEQGHPRGSLGLKHSEQTKAVIGQKSRAAWAAKTEDEKAAKTDKMMRSRIANGTLVPPRNASWKAGWRVIGGINKYYRSKWEANYARYLEWLKRNGQIIDWKHEPTTFWFDNIKRGTRSYLPDFWVQETTGAEAYHEVKGWMDDRSKTKLKRMAKYHPTVKIVLIEKAAYQSIAKTIKHLIPDWE